MCIRDRHRHVAYFAGMVGAYFRVDAAFDLGEFLRRHRLKVREVEAQAVGRDQRAFLLHVGAEHIAQGGVQQVGGAVVEHGRDAPICIDIAAQYVTDFQRA